MKKIIYLSLLAIFIVSCATTPDPGTDTDNFPLEMVTQTGHSMEASAIAYTPDGRYFITLSIRDGSIIIWRTSDNKIIRRITRGYRGLRPAIQIHPEENRVSILDVDEIFTFYISSGTLSSRIYMDKGDTCTTPCHDFSFSPDGKYIAGAFGEWLKQNGEGAIGVFNSKTGEKIWFDSSYSQSRFASVDYSSTAKYVAAASDSADGTVTVHDARTGKKHWEKSLNVPIRSIQFNPDGSDLVIGTENSEIICFDTVTGDQLYTLNLDDLEIAKSISFDSTGEFLLAGGMKKRPEEHDREATGFISVFNYDLHESVIKKEIKNLVNQAVWHPVNPVFAVAAGHYADSKVAQLSFEGEIISESDVFSQEMTGSYLSNDSNYIPIGGIPRIESEKGFINRLNLETLMLQPFASSNNIGVISIVPDRQKDSFFTVLYEGPLFSRWTVPNGETEQFHEPATGRLNFLAVSPDGTRIATSEGFARKPGEVSLWSAVEKKKLSSTLFDGWMTGPISFSPDGKLLALTTMKEEPDIPEARVLILDSSNLNVIQEIRGLDDFGQSVVFTPDGEKIITGNFGEIWDLKTGEKINQFAGEYGGIGIININHAGTIAATGYYESNVILWDTETAEKIKTLSGHEADISRISFSEDDRYILTASFDGTVRIWNLENDQSIAILSTGDEWVIYSDDGYFDASSDGGKLLGMTSGLDAYGIDQFALRYNRPDILMERMGFGTPETIEYFHRLYQKRLSKAGIMEEDLTGELHVPTAEITRRVQEGKILTLDLKFSDDLYALKRYNVYVNDVPIFGAYGREINEKDVFTGESNGNEASVSVEIELTSGENKIEVSCLNINGAESFRPVTYATYDKHIKGNLYFIGFGVSDYIDDELDLRYAAKDVEDLASVFQFMEGERFNKVESHIFLDESVTKENIMGAKSLLADAGVDDTFVLQIAGHGVHDSDQSATYYFLTHNADLENLPGTAANFELIEDLLQGIAPRNKLFLMDTCESGEAEPGVEAEFYSMADSRGILPRTTRGLKAISGERKSKTVTRSYLLDQNRFIHNDLFRRSGAIVFSSSKGGEFSYEDERIENGFFTEMVIQGLAGEADIDRNGIVMTDELRAYVSFSVAVATDGMQNPTVDRDNIYQKFGF